MLHELLKLSYLQASLLLGSSSTSDNLDQLAGNNGLASTVEKNLVPADHVTSVLGSVLVRASVLSRANTSSVRDTYVHSVTAGRLLASVSLSKSPVKGVGESVLLEVWKLILVNLESGEVGGSGDGLSGVSLNGGWLVRRGVEELVVNDADLVVLGWESRDLVSDGGSIHEVWNLLSDTGKVENDVLWVGTGELSSGLLSDEDKVTVWLLDEHLADQSGHSRVDTTAESLVGRGNNDQGLLVGALEWLGLSLAENGVGCLSVCAGVLHGLGGTVELGGGNNLHGHGDLLDVANRLETVLDLAKGRKSGGIWGNSATRTICQYSRLIRYNLAMRSRSNEAVDRRQNSCREKSYRVDAVRPARAAGRAALESMLGNKGGEIIAICIIWRFN